MRPFVPTCCVVVLTAVTVISPAQAAPAIDCGGRKLRLPSVAARDGISVHFSGGSLAVIDQESGDVRFCHALGRDWKFERIAEYPVAGGSKEKLPLVEVSSGNLRRLFDLRTGREIELRRQGVKGDTFIGSESEVDFGGRSAARDLTPIEKDENQSSPEPDEIQDAGSGSENSSAPASGGQN